MAALSGNGGARRHGTVRAAVAGRLSRLLADLLSLLTLRRREKAAPTYALRLASLGLLLVVLPVAKLLQLGPAGFALGLGKVAVAAALVLGVIAAAMAVEEWLRRRGSA